LWNESNKRCDAKKCDGGTIAPSGANKGKCVCPNGKNLNNKGDGCDPDRAAATDAAKEYKQKYDALKEESERNFNTWRRSLLNGEKTEDNFNVAVKIIIDKCWSDMTGFRTSGLIDLKKSQDDGAKLCGKLEKNRDAAIDQIRKENAIADEKANCERIQNAKWGPIAKKCKCEGNYEWKDGEGTECVLTARAAAKQEAAAAKQEAAAATSAFKTEFERITAEFRKKIQEIKAAESEEQQAG
jgi:hypothetical protein